MSEAASPCGDECTVRQCRFSEIFLPLKPAGGYISRATVERALVNPELKEALEPVLQEMEYIPQLSFQRFCQSLEILYMISQEKGKNVLLRGEILNGEAKENTDA